MSKRVSTVTEKPGRWLNFGPLKSAGHLNQKLLSGELFKSLRAAKAAAERVLWADGQVDQMLWLTKPLAMAPEYN